MAALLLHLRVSCPSDKEAEIVDGSRDISRQGSGQSPGIMIVPVPRLHADALLTRLHHLSGTIPQTREPADVVPVPGRDPGISYEGARLTQHHQRRVNQSVSRKTVAGVEEYAPRGSRDRFRREGASARSYRE